MRSALLAALLLCAGAAQAAFEDLGAGARGPGMANAFVPIADDVYALHYNPAGLGLLERPQLGTAYSALYPGLEDGSSLAHSFVGYAHPLADGRKGTLGAAWTSFTLNGSLYRDDDFGFAYGRQLLDSPTHGQLYGGLSLDYLRSSFGSFAEAANAVPAHGVTGGGSPDPLLSGARAKGAFDADLGLLHRFADHYAWGLAASHLLQPNVAFSGDSDKLPLGVKAGLAYRGLLTNISAQVDTQKGPTGGRDNVFSVGTERWFAKFLIGDFGLRGGLSLGSRDYKQVSTGVSFRTDRLGVDYSLILPLSGVGGTIGAHRVALTFRFGHATEEEQSVEAVLETMKQMRAGQLVAKKDQPRELPKASRAVLDEYLGQARVLEAKARYAEALDKMSEALQVAPANKDLVAHFGRLSFVGRQIKVLPEVRTDPSQASLHLGLLAYVAGDDAQAVERVAYALKLKPEWKELDLFLSQLESATGVKRPAGGAAAKPVDRDVVLKLTRANAAIEDSDFPQAVTLSLEVLRVDPKNATAWLDLATAYFGVRDYESSLRAWDKAYEYERTPAVRVAIKRYIRSIERLRRPQKPAVVAVRPLPKRLLSPEQEQRMLEESVDAYTRRDFGRAKMLLQTILDNDPGNSEALKALRRIQEEQP